MEEAFPGMGLVRNNPEYGNYIVASRPIEEGELIHEEVALLNSPYGPSDRIPFCLTCYKDLALSEKCPICKWPICGNDLCFKVAPHCNAECPIFAANGISHKYTAFEYTAIEVLRCLLLRDQDPAKWSKVMKFESHIIARKKSETALETTRTTIKFIRDKCKLTEYDEETIDKVLGILAVNTFWAHKDLKKYASLLFDRVTLLAHDCAHNTRRQIMEREVKDENNGHSRNEFFMRIWAKRKIEAGELLTTHYTDCDRDVKERRADLMETFYFECGCTRCLNELMAEVTLTSNQPAP